ncbi:MAG: pyruvate synthase subunit beta, partial [Deltaproteobacteria bacterium]|nr:pyruvate synthase subunit beta [Deltaproteobacteria bacterium]
NKKNTYEWYGKMVYKIPADHDVTDRKRGFELSLEWEERIPIGVLYRREDRPTFEELHPGVGDPPLHERGTSPEDVRDLLRKRLFTLP